VKPIATILIAILFVGIPQAQSTDWQDWERGEINCAVIRQIISTYGTRTLLRDVADAGNVSVKLMFEEVFGICKDDSATVSKTTSSRATSTPVSRLNALTIRSLVTRHTKDIRILDVEAASNSITIEYDLKPWHFVPNELIAEEVTFKIICALRKGEQISKNLKFIGQGRFKTDLGRKFKSPSVEIHISANTASQLVCQGNSYSDINWRRVSTVYKSYPVPKDASIDYD